MKQEEKAKAKAYDEVLKKARKELQICGSSDCDAARQIFRFFPQLKESDDRKIIERILFSLQKDIMATKNSGCDTKDLEECIAWLEKQGEQKQDPCEHCDDKRLNCHNFPCIKKKAFKQGKSALEVIIDEKVDKVEPKFKVGDWVVNRLGDVWHIDSFDKKNYQVSDGKGNYNYFPISKQDKMHHWTIQDAKAGDVLVYKENIKGSNGIKYERICLFNNFDNAFFILTTIFNDVEGYDIDVNINYPDDTIPATKEQRDILEKAMAGVGYTFNFGKKELKKIENKPADKVIPFDKYEGLTDFERTLADICIGWIGEEPGWEQYIKDNADVLLKIAAKKFNSVQDAAFDHKPAWSYEDEANLNNIIWLCNNCIKGSETTWIPSQATKIKHLIETIKEKGLVQQNPAWSEEDKMRITHLISLVEHHHNKDYDYFDYSDLAKWLKSLRPQNTWKPSEEQMNALEWQLGNTYEGSWLYKATKELYEQLKKLKEE